MEIKVGEYVRSKLGSIGKITKIEDNKFLYENKTLITWIGRVTKHSFNLVDLIEVGDILEIELSEEFVERNDKKVLIQLGDVYTKETLQKDIDNGIIQEIKKVLTHQQFEQNCYKTTTKQQT